MRRFWIGLTVAMTIVVTLVGCGSSDDGVAAETSTTTAIVTPATETSTTQAPATETSTTQAPAGDEWKTIATLRSTDSPWQGMEGLLISEPFTAAGEVQLVLDMPDAGDIDGLIVAIVPADEATDPIAMIDAIRDGISVTMPATMPTAVVTVPDDTYVLLNSVPEPKAWSVEVQTRP